MENLETLAITIFEAGANALYQTIDENDDSCSNPKKYDELKQESVKVFLENTKLLIDEIAELKKQVEYQKSGYVTLKEYLKTDDILGAIIKIKSDLKAAESVNEQLSRELHSIKHPF